MKAILCIDRMALSLLFILTISISGQAQKQYHVIVGAFAVKSNAEKFTGYVRSAFYDARFDLHKNSNLHYVYVYKALQRKEAYDYAKQLQQESEFKDAWVYYGELQVISPPEVVKNIEVPITKADSVLTSPKEVTMIDTVTSTTTLPDSAATLNVNIDVIEEEPAPTPKGKLFKFVILSPDGKPVQANVHNVDYLRGRDLATYQTGKYIDVLPPSATNNPMTVVCGVFGYKEIIKLIDYTHPETAEGAIQDATGAWIIPYTLERMNTGDVSVMYHVSFYKDAVVMLAASKSEMDELVNMMLVNPDYKIKIHGHCNGTNNRRIIALGETKNYFDIKGSNEIEGSAKELSRLRAEAVQSYLVDNGIDKNRTEIQAWGGTNMLVAETSNSAKLNDRIEIEILKH